MTPPDSSVSAELIANGLNKSKQVGPDKFTACCPAHDDKNPSLSITDKNGMVLVYCHAGCSQEQVIGALRDMGLWYSSNSLTIIKSHQKASISEIQRHQILLATELARVDQGHTHTADDQVQIEKSVCFLEENSHG